MKQGLCMTWSALFFLALAGAIPAQELKGKSLRRALKDKAAGFWVYNDIQAGYDQARKKGKPLLVSFRCVP